MFEQFEICSTGFLKQSITEALTNNGKIGKDNLQWMFQAIWWCGEHQKMNMLFKRNPLLTTVTVVLALRCLKRLKTVQIGISHIRLEWNAYKPWKFNKFSVTLHSTIWTVI